MVEVARPTLYLLSIGVSQYGQNPPQDLRFAAKDAKDFATLLLGQEDGLYGEVKPMVLCDGDADFAAIIGGLRWLRENVRERDMVMLFLAGHGAAPGGDYFFLPHDVDARTQDDLAVSAVRRDQLRGGLRALNQAGAKVLAFIDSCHAGAAFEQTRSLEPDLDQLAAELASAENGVVVFTAGTGRELAWEAPDWGNGAFTRALLDALGGAAGGDGHVRVSDLQRYLPRRVRELTGNRQNPRIYVPFQALLEAPIALLR
jgi:uncharacterized caspase-like protein